MERVVRIARRIDVRRRLLVLPVIALLAGCGTGSTGALDQAATPEATHIYEPAPDSKASPVPITESTPTLAPPVAASPPPPSAAPRSSSVGVVSATAGTATTGPGRRTSPAASPSPRPSPSPSAGTVTVTDDDSGATVHLVVGQHLRVRLSKDTYDPPQSSADRVVVRRTSSGGYPSDQPVDTTFDAVAKGSADVTATSDAACFHTEPRCMMPQREWRVTVVVG